MSNAYADYVDYYEDLSNEWNNNPAASWEDYGNYHGEVKTIWDNLGTNNLQNSRANYQFEDQNTVNKLLEALNLSGQVDGITVRNFGSGTIENTPIGTLNNFNEVSFQRTPGGQLVAIVNYQISEQNNYEVNAQSEGRTGYDLFSQQHHDGTGFWNSDGIDNYRQVPGIGPDFVSGETQGKRIPFKFINDSGEPQYFSKDIGKEQKSSFGYAHWNKENTQKNEMRIIPVDEILSVGADGKLKANEDYITTGYKTNFTDLTNAVNNGIYADDYKSLVDSFSNRFPEKDNNFITKNIVSKPNNAFEAAYIANNISNEERWDIEKDGAKAVLMDGQGRTFDADYYATTDFGRDAADEYRSNASFTTSDGTLINNPDYTVKYSANGVDDNGIPYGYYSKYYTEKSQEVGFDPFEHRATAEAEEIAAEKYKETVTDSQKEMLRSYALGLGGGAFDPATQSYQQFKNSLSFALDPADNSSAFFETDEDGNILYRTDPETGAQTPIPKQIDIFTYETIKDDDGNPILDENGDVQYVSETDEEGNIIYETDEEGNIIYETDLETGENILDAEGNPIPIPVRKIAYEYEYEYETDDEGNEILDADGKPVLVYEPERDENGNLIYQTKVDAEGRPVPREDQQGNPLKDSNGNILYQQEIKRTEQPRILSETPIYNENFYQNPTNSLYGASVFNIYGAKDLAYQDQFQQLALDAFKTSYDKLKEVKKEESELAMLSGLPGYDEIYSANESIANSILGDSGIGGYLSMVGVDVQEMQENLENQLSGVTGISNNSVIFNWEKWFEEEFTQRYTDLNTIESNARATIEELDPEKAVSNYAEFQEKIENTPRLNDNGIVRVRWQNLMKEYGFEPLLSEEEALRQANPESWTNLMERYGLSPDTTKEEALAAFSEMTPVLDDDGLTIQDEDGNLQMENKYNLIYELEEDFKNSFIEDYLQPRFDNSKSMDEFISYLDSLDPDEQNILQTETGLTAIKDVAEKNAKKKLNDIYHAEDQAFDYQFYMNPLGIDEEGNVINAPGWAEDDAKYKDYELFSPKLFI